MAHTPAAATQRLDRWLWCARFAKSRSLAARLCTSEKVTLGGATVQKAHQALRIGDRLTLRIGRFERRIEVLALGQRRGPASEARALYAEADPPTLIGEGPAEWSPLIIPDGELEAERS